MSQAREGEGQRFYCWVLQAACCQLKHCYRSAKVNLESTLENGWGGGGIFYANFEVITRLHHASCVLILLDNFSPQREISSHFKIAKSHWTRSQRTIKCYFILEVVEFHKHIHMAKW